jgi:hypothetical protein
MLSDDKGRCELTSGVRPGSICAETVGSIAASIVCSNNIFSQSAAPGSFSSKRWRVQEGDIPL